MTLNLGSNKFISLLITLLTILSSKAICQTTSYGDYERGDTIVINGNKYKVHNIKVEPDNLLLHGLSFKEEDSLADGNWAVIYNSVKKDEKLHIFCYGSISDGKKQGKWAYFYFNGTKAEVHHFKNGKLHGKIIGYYSDGTKQFKTLWINGTRRGVWKNWDKEGDLRKKTYYRRGVKYKTVTYH